MLQCWRRIFTVEGWFCSFSHWGDAVRCHYRDIDMSLWRDNQKELAESPLMEFWAATSQKGFGGEDSAFSTYKHCWWETLVAVVGTMMTVWCGFLVFVYPQKLKGWWVFAMSFSNCFLFLFPHSVSPLFPFRFPEPAYSWTSLGKVS